MEGGALLLLFWMGSLLASATDVYGLLAYLDWNMNKSD
jgi:hypothetical protein